MDNTYVRYLKPTGDRLVSIVLLVLTVWLWFPALILLWIANKGKPFFIQARPGKDEKVFRLIKFKTMNDRKDEYGELLPDDVRLTWIGKLVRKTSVDELPQLVNVIKGDMSLIGPRPWLLEYLPLYNDFQRRRHLVKPGITGWAQVNGRNLMGWTERFRFDNYYVDHCSFGLDMKILLLTIYNILRAKGISGEQTATMEKFKGNAS